MHIAIIEVVGDKEEIASRDELSKTLYVESVDVNIPENTKNHRTDQYACIKTRKTKDGTELPPELVVRRGQAFTIKINFNQTFSREKHHTHLIMATGKRFCTSDCREPNDSSRNVALVVLYFTFHSRLFFTYVRTSLVLGEVHVVSLFFRSWTTLTVVTGMTGLF